MPNPSHGLVNNEKARAAYQAAHERMQANPSSGRATLRATAELVKDMFIQGRSGHFHFECDEPPARAGDDAAPSPLEFFLVGAAF